VRFYAHPLKGGPEGLRRAYSAHVEVDGIVAGWLNACVRGEMMGGGRRMCGSNDEPGRAAKIALFRR
jgi:hypothetical protein